MPKVSVIIPVYGVEAYIERCAQSLFEQTLDDIEYIFVNDCTIDRSIEILNRVLNNYPSRKNQVKVFNMERNSGQAAVRKKGIELATGEYIIHCDSDDYIDRDMYRQMYEKAKEGDYDIVVCDFNEGNETQWKRRKGKVNESTDLVSDIMLLIVPAVWNKLIKCEIVHDPSIEYPILNMGEDVALTMQYSLLAGSVGYVEQPLYYYVRRFGSISGNRSKDIIINKVNQLTANINIAVDAINRKGR